MKLVKLSSMKLLIDSFWRAVMYCLYPRVIGLSVFPLVLIVALSWLLGYWYWDIAVTWVRGWLDASSWLAVVWRWLEGIGLPEPAILAGGGAYVDGQRVVKPPKLRCAAARDAHDLSKMSSSGLVWPER